MLFCSYFLVSTAILARNFWIFLEDFVKFLLLFFRPQMKSIISQIFFKKYCKAIDKSRELSETMEIVAIEVDLPVNIKRMVVRELAVLKCVLDNEAPIGYGPFGFVYRARRLRGGYYLAVKVVLIPKIFDNDRNMLLRYIKKQVNRYK